MTTAARSALLPDIPTVGDIRAGLAKRASGTASARLRSTPAEIIDKLNREINAALADPKIEGAALTELGGVPSAGVTPARVRQAHRRMTPRSGQGDPWTANIKPD